MTHNVEIYTLAYCPYCQKAKFFLKEHNLEFNEINCDDDEEIMREELTKKFNLSELATFPQIVIDGKHIGGYTDMIAKHQTGELVF